MPTVSRAARRLALPALLLTTLVACFGGSKPAADAPMRPAPPPEEQVGTPLATVSGLPVGTAAFAERVKRQVPADGAAWSDVEKQQILDEMIEEELLFQEAFKRAVYQDPKIRRILKNLLLQQEIFQEVKNEDFTEEQLRAYYDENPNDFSVPAKVQVLRIFVAELGKRSKEEAQTLATALHEAVVKDPGKTFREVAVERSEDTFAARGGDLGLITRDGKPGVPEGIVARAFQLTEGEVSEPFEAAGGFNILWVPQRRDRIERSYEQSRNAILRKLKTLAYDEQSEAFVAKLRAEAKIEVDEAALAAFTPPARERPTRTGLPGEGEIPPPEFDLDPVPEVE